tara:strand:+ start:1088 stop:1603 length:516 start_codon:yes stop_codon:yes gene_type:complete
MKELWFGQAGVTLSQHGDGDDRFPGWQESFGAGTYLGNDDFPNDDASHIEIDSGYTATLREHGPSDDRYPGNEYTYTGPTTMNLNHFNDELSELEVDEIVEPTPDPIPDPIPDPTIEDEIIDADIPVDVPDMPDTDTGDVDEAGLAGGGNTMLYVGIGAVALVAIVLMMKK